MLVVNAARCTLALLAALVMAMVLLMLLAQPVLAYETQGETGVQLQQLKRQFPNAAFKQLTLQQFQQLRLAVSDINAERAAPQQTAQVRAAVSSSRTGSDPCRPATDNPPETQGQSSGDFDVFVDVVDDMGGGDSDAAMVFFVIIGVVVVAALVVYSGKFLYDLATDSLECPPWWELGLRSSLLLDENFSGHMNALRFSAGLRDPATSLGFAFEYGEHDIDIHSALQGDFNVDGAYWLAGAEIRWFLNPNGSFWFVELLGGRSSSAALDVISTARMGLSLATGGGRFGLNLGALYTDLEQTTGVLADVDQYHMSLGISWGVQF